MIGPDRARLVPGWGGMLVGCVLWIGCTHAEPKPESHRSAVGKTSASASLPQPSTSRFAAVIPRDWVDAVRRGAVPAACDAAVVEAIRRVDQRHGTFLFDNDGNLRGVDLAGQRVSVREEDVAVVSALPGLRRLLLAGPAVTSRSVDALCRQAELTELMLQDVAIADADLQRLASLEKLESLTLRRCANLTDEGLAALAEYPSLSRLELLDNGFSDRAMDHLVRLTNLRLLDLRGCDRIGTAGLERLAEFQRLVAVRLGGYPVNDGVLRTLAGIKSLRSITLDEGGVTDEGLTALGDLDLEEVSLARCLNLTDGGFAVFERIENLKSASFRDLAITDAALAYLGSRRRLETLVLRELLITDAGLNHLKGLAALRHLSLRQIAISDTGTAALGGMTRLETLDLAGNRLTAAALPALANLVRLKTLDLSDNPEIADAAVEPLGRMRQLRSLRLWQTGFSPEGLNWLRQRLADCEIVYDRPL